MSVFIVVASVAVASSVPPWQAESINIPTTNRANNFLGIKDLPV
jgi:hypothetical protein